MDIHIPYKISIPTNEESETINDKMDEFNGKQLSYSGQVEVFKNYIIKDDDKIIAGIKSVFYLGECLAINVLFVDEQYRHQKLGSALLKRVETEVKVLGGKLVHLDTFDFQAKDFYLKHGYEIFGTLNNCPQGHTRYYLKKDL